MTKIKKTIEVDLCDKCDAEDAGYVCVNCGKTFCYQCRESQLVTYKQQHYFQSSGDPMYCLACNSLLRAHPTAYFQALMTLEDLVAFRKQQCATMDVRIKAAEHKVASLRE